MRITGTKTTNIYIVVMLMCALTAVLVWTMYDTKLNRLEEQEIEISIYN